VPLLAAGCIAVSFISSAWYTVVVVYYNIFERENPMVIKNTDEIMTVRQAARECGKNPETIRRWIWSGKLAAKKSGNQLFVKKTELDIVCSNKNAPDRQQSMFKFIERAANLRKEIKESGKVLDTVAIIEDIRKEREDEIESSLR
jgi:excisionase family DNA binding protein